MDGQRARAIRAGILAVVVTACSSGAEPTATVELIPLPTAASSATPGPTSIPTPAPTSSPSPTPEPTPDLAAIGSAYLAMADRFNARVLPILGDLAAGGQPDEERLRMHQQVVDAFDVAMADLDTIPFPPEIADEVAGIRAAWAVIREAFAAVRQDPSHDAFAVLDEQSAVYGPLSDTVREHLGLPPRPTGEPGE